MIRAPHGSGFGARRLTPEMPRFPSQETEPLNDPESKSTPTPPWILLAGAAIGLGLATFGLLEHRGDTSTLPSDAAAVVGERTIRRVDYKRVLAGVEGDMRSPIDEAMRRRVLDRMIDEELLVQRALELGLAVIDRRVRGELTSGLIDSIVSEVDAEEPSESEVAKHYEANIDFFTRPGRLRARTILFSARGDDNDPRGSAQTRAEQALSRLRGGESTSDVERALGDSQVSPVPDTMLPASKVRDYVGPTILETLAGLETRSWSEPISSGSGLYLATPLERDPAIVPPLDEIESLVRQDLKRRRGDEALRDYLLALRTQTPVAIDEALFDIDVDAAKATR
jgi:hypothetical protein